MNKYNTRNAVSSIPNREIRSKKSLKEIHQVSYLYLFLEILLERNN